MVHLKICVLLLLCALLLGFADPSAVATDFDVVVPKSGHPLFGAFQDIMDGGISLVLDSGSTLNIPWEKIKELQLNHKVTNPSAAEVKRGVIALRAGLVMGTQGQQMLGGSLEVKRTAHPAREDWHRQSTELELGASSLLITQAGVLPFASMSTMANSTTR